ncbi:o-succinylbenzoate synthase [Salegentibacter sp. HM20]
MQASYLKYNLKFKRPSGTSRGVLTTKETWFLKLSENGKTGIGECGILRGLSYDDRPDFEQKLKWLCDNINLGEEKLWQDLEEYPSIRFGLEMALKSLQAEDKFLLFPSEFTSGKSSIPINGLIWMGDKAYMKAQIEEKIKAGFSCIKLKIGAIDFQNELDLLKFIRSEFSSEEIELRVDANGAFSPGDALEKLKRLSDYELHSIEQPIKQGQWTEMAALCEQTPLPIALDEELIGVFKVSEKKKLLEAINPQYLIFKPSLLGGYRATGEWIDLLENSKTDYWLTSALESNVGLNAIAQWTYTLKPQMPQGLGTGGLYTNNFDSPLEIIQGNIHYNPELAWKFNL